MTFVDQLNCNLARTQLPIEMFMETPEAFPIRLRSLTVEGLCGKLFFKWCSQQIMGYDSSLETRDNGLA